MIAVKFIVCSFKCIVTCDSRVTVKLSTGYPQLSTDLSTGILSHITKSYEVRGLRVVFACVRGHV
jgi:hypothetical protein